MREKSEMNLREAAQQALEALEVWRDSLTDPSAIPGWRFSVVGEKAVANLRAALTEDAMQRLTDVQQETDCYGDGNVYRGQRSSDSKIPTLTINGMPAVEGPLSKAQRTGQESPQVEPVAFIHKNFERRIREVLTEADFGGDKLAFLRYCMSDGNLLPLYAAPPKREPLSEEEISAIDWKSGETLHDFARAIERAHGIGGAE